MTPENTAGEYVTLTEISNVTSTINGWYFAGDFLPNLRLYIRSRDLAPECYLRDYS